MLQRAVRTPPHGPSTARSRARAQLVFARRRWDAPRCLESGRWPSARLVSVRFGTPGVALAAASLIVDVDECAIGYELRRDVGANDGAEAGFVSHDGCVAEEAVSVGDESRDRSDQLQPSSVVAQTSTPPDDSPTKSSGPRTTARSRSALLTIRGCWGSRGLREPARRRTSPRSTPARLPDREADRETARAGSRGRFRARQRALPPAVAAALPMAVPALCAPAHAAARTLLPARADPRPGPGKRRPEQSKNAR
jgi:hypothetical protein